MIIVNSTILNSFRNKILVARQVQFKVRKMSNKCKVAIIQFTASNNKNDNLNSVRKLVSEAVDKNAKVKYLLMRSST